MDKPSQGISPQSSLLERWLRSPRRFRSFSEAKTYLPCPRTPDARIKREDGRWVIRTPDGRYLLHGDVIGFPVSPNEELQELPVWALNPPIGNGR